MGNNQRARSLAERFEGAGRSRTGAPDSPACRAFRSMLLEQGRLRGATVRHYVWAARRLEALAVSRGHWLGDGCRKPSGLLRVRPAPAHLLQEVVRVCGQSAGPGAEAFAHFLRRERGSALDFSQGYAPRRRPLGPAGLRAYLRQCAEAPAPYRTLLWLLPLSGLRPIALCRLHRSGVLSNGRELRASAHRARLGLIGRAALRRYLEWLERERALELHADEPADPFLFPLRGGGSHVRRKALSRWVNVVAAKTAEQSADVEPNFRSEALRQTYFWSERDPEDRAAALELIQNLDLRPGCRIR